MVGFVEASVTDEDNSSPEGGASSGGAANPHMLEDMPRSSYVPIVKEPLVLIKSRMLQEFDLLDCAFNGIAAALRDFALRANRCGYRVVRANHARVTARGWERGDSGVDERDAEALRARFPYLAQEIARHENSSDARARKLLAGLRPNSDGRRNIVFACNNLGKIHNGTSELAKRVITEFSLNHSSEYQYSCIVQSGRIRFSRLWQTPRRYPPEWTERRGRGTLFCVDQARSALR